MSGGTARDRPARGGASDRPGILELILFIAGLGAAGLVTLALLWSGVGPYADLARDNHVQSVSFLRRNGDALTVDLPAVLDVHRLWSRYVTGATSGPPAFDADIRFTAEEYGHMADVRGVFDAAKYAAAAGVIVMFIRFTRARAASSARGWRLVRDGAIAAAALIAILGVLALVAFEPLFLAFHYVFFPQGNFLFDPGASNLVRLYPDWYWEGMSLRVGLSFFGVALPLAAIAHLRLRAAK